jgi:hypothetical protein
MILKENVVTYWDAGPEFIWRDWKKKQRENNRCPDRNSNREIPEYKPKSDITNPT